MNVNDAEILVGPLSATVTNGYSISDLAANIVDADGSSNFMSPDQ